MMFDTSFTHRDKLYSASGSGQEQDYNVHFSKSGVRSLEPVGKIDRYSEIQSYKDSCDVNVIIKRYVEGDFGALDRRNPFYIDTTVIPDTYAEFFNAVQGSKDFFYSLDPDVRVQFNNSFEQFIVSGGVASLPSGSKEVSLDSSDSVEKEVLDES